MRWAVLALVVAVVAGFLLWRNRNRQEETAGIRTAKVTRGSLTQTIASTGIVAAETGADVKIGSQITGRIRRLYVDVGDKVQAGQVIAELDAPDLAANLESARRNLGQAEARYQQQLEGVPIQHAQVTNAFEQATDSLHRAEAQREQAAAALRSARTRLQSAQAALTGAQSRRRAAEANLRSAELAAAQQPEQTSAEVARAQAAFSTAQSNLTQVQKSADLQVTTAEASLKQAEANAALALASLQRQESLLAKGYVAAQEVDNARTQSEVAARQVESARANLALTREKVAADLQAAKDAVTSAHAALAAAQAGTYQNQIRTEAVKAAEASLAEANAAVAQAEQSVESARAEVASSEAQLKAAESDIRNARAAQQTALANLTQDKLKQREVQAAYEAVRQARAQVAYQEAQFSKSVIRTPISGTVVMLTQQEGETVAAGLAAPTLLEVVDLDRLQVNAYVDETDIAQVRVGQRASVTVDAYPDRAFTGKVANISSAATVQQNVVTYVVTVDLDKYPAGALKPQMTANVTITVAEKNDVLLVPNEAIKRRKEATQVVVMVGGKPEVRQVTTGMSDEGSTEVSEGLQEGEEVVLAGFEKLGLPEFGSAAQLPRFFQRGPLGTGGGTRGGGTSRGGGAPPPPPPPPG